MRQLFRQKARVPKWQRAFVFLALTFILSLGERKEKFPFPSGEGQAEGP